MLQRGDRAEKAEMWRPEETEDSWGGGGQRAQPDGSTEQADGHGWTIARRGPTGARKTMSKGVVCSPDSGNGAA
jgi:hypothetical protein